MCFFDTERCLLTHRFNCLRESHSRTMGCSSCCSSCCNCCLRCCASFCSCFLGCCRVLVGLTLVLRTVSAIFSKMRCPSVIFKSTLSHVLLFVQAFHLVVAAFAAQDLYNLNNDLSGTLRKLALTLHGDNVSRTHRAMSYGNGSISLMFHNLFFLLF